MKWLCFLFSAIIYFSSCTRDETKLLPGEKFMIDTIMYAEYRAIDKEVGELCDLRFEDMVRKSFDSIFRLRIADVRSIKGADIPPAANRFPDMLKQNKPLKKPQNPVQ